MSSGLKASFTAALVVLATVGAAPALKGEPGPCYTGRPLPPLVSGTRVFVRPALILTHKGTALIPPGAPTETALILGASLSGIPSGPATVTGDPDAPDKAPRVVLPSKDGNSTVITAATMVCAFPPDWELPSNLKNATPDIVIP